MVLSQAQIERYSRQIILPEVGGIGQERLLQTRVLVVGAGGLGSAAVLYLAAAGVGHLGLVDDDRVEISNLHRQVLYVLDDVGAQKTDAARSALRRLNPDCRVEAHALRLDASSAGDLIGRYDIVVDGSDNFPTRFLVNDTCVDLSRPLVSGSVLRFDGQASTYLGFRDDAPCYRCLFPEPPPPGLYPADADCGVFGVVVGLVGTIVSTEVLKLALGIGTPLVGRLLVYDALTSAFRQVDIPKAPDCRTCARRVETRRAVAE